MARRCSVPPEIQDIMFSLWVSGFSYEEIRRHMEKQNLKYSLRVIETLGARNKWANRRKAIVSATKDYYDDIIKASKQKQMRAYALAADALCDQIIDDYMEYKQDTAAFNASVLAGTRRRPIWMIGNSKEAQVLLETQYMLLMDFRKGPDTQVNIQNNNIEVQQVLSEEDKSNLLHLLAEAKAKTAQGELIQEAEIVKIPEKCTKT